MKTKVWCCCKCPPIRAIKWILAYDSIALCITLIGFILLTINSAYRGFLECFFIISIQLPRVVTQIIMIAKKYRRDWAFICLSVRVTTLITGFAAWAYILAAIFYYISIHGFGKRISRELRIVLLISAIFIFIDGYFCWIYRYYIKDLDSRISAASRRVESMQIWEMEYEVDNKKDEAAASDDSAIPYQHIELSQERDPATKSDI